MNNNPKVAALFKGKDTPAEEKKEARAVKAGKITPAQYAKGEKSEGEKDSKAALMKRAKDMKSGKLTPAQYAKKESKK
jgi:hypothetical protein